MSVVIPWRELGHRKVPAGHDRCLVLCASCNAPIAVLDTPPADGPQEPVRLWQVALVNVSQRHRKQHRPGWDPRVSLLMEKDIPDGQSLVNLLGRNWPGVLERLAS